MIDINIENFPKFKAYVLKNPIDGMSIYGFIEEAYLVGKNECKSDAINHGHWEECEQEEIKWHKYPEETPDVLFGMYIVKVKSWLSGCVEVRMLAWSSQRFLDLGGDEPLEWAEIPEKWKEIEKFEDGE